MGVRVGLIGAGVMGADHAHILARHVPGVQLRIICDANEARARDIADAVGAEHATRDAASIIADKSIDAVLIASPDATHGPLTLACLEARKPVLCEKPLSQLTSECLSVIAAEAKTGKRLVQIGFMRRFDPSYLDMKQALLEGTIGAPLMMHNFHRNVSAPPSFTGQMAITNSAPHEFDIARFVLDTEYQSIAVFQPARSDPQKAGAPVFMVLRTVAGQLVNVEINNNAAYGYDVRGELVGEAGSVSLRSPVASEVSLSLKRMTSYPADWRPRFADAYRLQNAAWIKSIETGHPTGASAWDGYVAAAVAEAGVQALQEGRTMAISLSSKPKIY